MFFLIVIPALLICDPLFWWWADHRFRKVAQPSRVRAVARGLLAAFMLFQIVGYVAVIGSRWTDARFHLPAIVLSGLYIWHLLAMPITIVSLLIWQVLKLIARGTLKSRGPEQPDPLATGHALHPTRRQFLTAVAASVPPIVTVMSTGISYAGLNDFRVRRLTIPLRSLPRDLDGLTIAHVSDVHVGRFTRPKTLPAIAEATNNLRADLVLVTGDTIDFTLADLPAGIDMLKRIDPHHGLFMCEGNHDLFEDRNAFEQRVLRAGIPLLLNDARTVRIRGIDVQLLGIKWGGPRLDRTRLGHMTDQHAAATLPLARVKDPGAFPIFLAHHPHAFDHAAQAGVPLTLAGHTHGGQLMLTKNIGAGPLMFKYWSGLYRKDDAALVVSNGVGNWFPVRTNAPAEIVHITLRTA